MSTDIEVSSEPPGVALTVESWFEWAIERDVPLTREELETASARVGRNPAITLLFDLHYESLLSPDAYRLAGSLWSVAEFPESYLRNEWIDVFELAGYCVDGLPSPRPAEPLTLYRGATPEGKTGMSWTDDHEIARRFASGELWGRQTPGVLWTAKVEPWRLLCRNHEDGRHEAEYVIDPAGLEVREST